MMIEASVPLRFWVQACRNSVFLTNCTITKALNNHVIPFEVWHFRKPSVNNIRIFGSLAYSIVREELRGSKFTPVSSKGVLVGFGEYNYNYHIFEFNTQKIIITNHTTFNENKYPFFKHATIQTDQNPEAAEHYVSRQFFNEDSDEESITEDAPVSLEVLPDETEPKAQPSAPDQVSPFPQNPAVSRPEPFRRSLRVKEPVNYSAVVTAEGFEGSNLVSE